VADYDTAARQAFAMAGPNFMDIFALDREPDALREGYGGEFGQRLLLSRRLVEGGVRFIEVSHNLGFVNGTGWDTHNEGQLKQHLLIEELDKGLAALITDLESKKLLDKTLIVVATEFGRTPEIQAEHKDGRDHHPAAYSCLLAGGGIKGGMKYGETDASGDKVKDKPVTVQDFNATIAAALGLPHELVIMSPSKRPFKIADKGVPVKAVLG